MTAVEDVLAGRQRWAIVAGDARATLAELPDSSIHCIVTSPPYWGLRDYGVDQQIGLEPTLGAYVDALVAVFRDVRRVLRADGVCWLNLGDSYAGGGGLPAGDGLKPKDLIGVPWRVAFALQADGWWLRADVIWAKRNPMPESVTDRPTRSHEYLFLLSKSARYAYDADAIREPAEYGRGEYPNAVARSNRRAVSSALYRNVADAREPVERGMSKVGAVYDPSAGRNKRTVWTFATEPYPGAHFATFPTRLAEPCILAGCPTGGIVLDPFAGAGTTVLVALRNGRRALGAELSPAYCELARDRIERDCPLFNASGAAP